MYGVRFYVLFQSALYLCHAIQMLILSVHPHCKDISLNEAAPLILQEELHAEPEVKAIVDRSLKEAREKLVKSLPQ